jgi:glycosyltransferase involved in cell wall biosynthesis/uncharacterized SAM-binding protein YcdF (DUF218 family)
VTGGRPADRPAAAGRDVLLFSSIDWSRNWQVHQQLATSLVESGHRVLFIENTGVRAPRATASDFTRMRARLRNWLRSIRGFVDVREQLTVCSLLVLPFPYLRPAIAANRWWVTHTIRRWMEANRFRDPLVISFLPTPLVQGVIDALDPVAVLYYCADDMAGGSAGARPLRAHEERFFARADAVLCTSHALAERARRTSRRVRLIPAGVDLVKFDAAQRVVAAPPELAAIPAPRAGYVGTVGRVFDQALLCEAARALPGVQFVLVGPVSVEVAALQAMPNVHLLGPKAHDEIPACIAAFDVTLVPYLRTRYTESVYSCKLNEYLAVGKPVVTTDLPEMRRYAAEHPGVLAVVPDAAGFVQAIREALGPAGEDGAPGRRRQAAERNSWARRYHDIVGVIGEVLGAAQAPPHRWEDRLRRAMRRGRRRVLAVALAAGAGYGLLAHTPLVPWLGGQLVVRQAPSPVAQAIVVFSGDGEPGYVNAAYQRRAADALALYRRGFGRLVVLSSGKRFTMAETEVIRALLINAGVPPGVILTTSGVPASTYENVVLAAGTLRRLRVRHVNLVTAPYHSRRAALVWARQAPDIDVTVATPADDSAADGTGRVSLRRARVIAFEYLAIVYYRLLGWL